MGVLEFLVSFYPINNAWVVFSSDLKMDPLNLYPTYRLNGLRGWLFDFNTTKHWGDFLGR